MEDLLHFEECSRAGFFLVNYLSVNIFFGHMVLSARIAVRFMKWTILAMFPADIVPQISITISFLYHSVITTIDKTDRKTTILCLKTS